MHGELAYKDIHGRVWRIQAGLLNWHARTLDVAHTEHDLKSEPDFAKLLASIDREEFVTDDRAARPFQSGEARGQEPHGRRESQPESIEEIRRYASEIDGNEPSNEHPPKRSEERGE